MKILLFRIVVYGIIGVICRYFVPDVDLMHFINFCVIADLYRLIYDDNRIEFVEFKDIKDDDDEHEHL